MTLTFLFLVLSSASGDPVVSACLALEAVGAGGDDLVASLNINRLVQARRALASGSVETISYVGGIGRDVVGAV